MTIEHAYSYSLKKPWGVADTRPWLIADNPDCGTIGEVWYERPSLAGTDPSLLLKLLFTNQPLSIQVHPDDGYAQLNGLQNGKTEAWYVLSAAPGAKVALGLRRRMSSKQLRHAINDESIADLVAWQQVGPGDVISVSAGTIHAIGAGLVIAEIQQRSDTTFRLFDHGRGRQLHVEEAVAVANPGPADDRDPPKRLSDRRMLLASNSYFTFERIDLAPKSSCCLDATRETWLLAVRGSAYAEAIHLMTGVAVFAQSDRVNLRAGMTGVTALVAYTGSFDPELLQDVDLEAAL
jgi:mannose-6-phosphate isomerase